MAFIFNPACRWYSAADVKEIVREAIEHTVLEMLERQISDLERLSDELSKVESRIKC